MNKFLAFLFGVTSTLAYVFYCALQESEAEKRHLAEALCHASTPVDDDDDQFEYDVRDMFDD